MDKLFNIVSKRIRIYISREVVSDPFEKTVTTTEISSIPISAIVSEISFGKIQWVMPGIVTDKVKQIIIKKRHLNLLKKSQKIQITGESDYYEGYKTNGRLQFKIEMDFVRAYIYVKKA